MCGIAGFLALPGSSSIPDWRAIAGNMAEAVRARGPDQGGVWRDPQTPVVFGHRRLSIIDLSPAGQQPMSSADGRCTITLNGEVYNFSVLRGELEQVGHRFRGRSDTEVFLAAVSRWGIRDALERSVGMFAFALWDRETKTLTLARDRLGEKPLYFGWQGDVFLFGSSLSALRAHPAFRAEVDRDALTLLLRYGYIPAPRSIYRGIQKLPPGSLLALRYGETELSPRPYWSARSVAEQGQARLFQGSEAEAAENLEELIRRSVRDQMVADVPVGAFLSGGVDSSTVVALMQSQSAVPVKTFTIGFHEDDYNEAVHAKAIAERLGTQHTELYVTPGQALDVIPQLPMLYDEPFADASQIPTFLMAKLARQHVTVALSGDGGDELFAGYNRYMAVQKIWRRIAWMPHPIRAAAAKALDAVRPPVWRGLAAASASSIVQVAEKARKAIALLSSRYPEDVYQRLVSRWPRPADIVIGGTEPSAGEYQRALPDLEHEMMCLDASTYLPDDLLVKVDRAAMGIGLETRVPLLDHRIFEFAWRLPVTMKIHEGVGKRVLREVLYKHVPRHLIERPKMGFSVPIDGWLRGPLRDWAEALLDARRIDREGFFRSEPVQHKWREHLRGKHDWQDELWSVLMFQAWLESAKRP